MRAAILVALFSCFQWFPLAYAATEINFGRYHALVIGINSYENLTDLETAVNDASAVHDLLRRQYGFSSRLLLNPTRYQIVAAFDRLRAELTEEDNLLIYYAGHGVLDRGSDEGFWLAVDAEEHTRANWVSVYSLTRTLRAMSAKQILVIADSCYSGTLTRDAPLALETGAERIAELRRLATKRSRKALTSGGLEPVYDGGGDGHSIFTRALLTVLQDNDQPLDGYQLFTQIRPKVIKAADQTPAYADIRFADDDDGDFIFVPVTLTSPPTPAAPAANFAVDKETVFWQSIQDSRSASDYQAYLQQYPLGAFAPLARSRIAALERPDRPAPVAAPVTPPRILVEPSDETLMVLKTANVRARPTAQSQKLSVLPSGTRVAVTGRVSGIDWYRIAHSDGTHGYVYGPLLGDEPPPPKPVPVVKQAPASPDQDAPAQKQAALPPSIDGRWLVTVLWNEGRLSKADLASIDRDNAKSVRTAVVAISNGKFSEWLEFQGGQGSKTWHFGGEVDHAGRLSRATFYSNKGYVYDVSGRLESAIGEGYDGKWTLKITFSRVGK